MAIRVSNSKNTWTMTRGIRRKFKGGVPGDLPAAVWKTVGIPKPKAERVGVIGWEF